MKIKITRRAAKIGGQFVVSLDGVPPDEVAEALSADAPFGRYTDKRPKGNTFVKTIEEARALAQVAADVVACDEIEEAL